MITRLYRDHTPSQIEIEEQSRIREE